ncbi:MAG: DUF4091 domain-containing protein [Anaerolineae bacterium]|nr:DUF4091 domain-containing protein [Anaerolineae bacterium]
MKRRVRRLYVLVGLCLVGLVSFAAPLHTGAVVADPWWNEAWPYRVRVAAGGSGVIGAAIDFTAAFEALGLNHALLDLRSVRVVPYTGAAPGVPIAYAETYSTLLEDADAPQIGWHGSGVYWTVNDGTAAADGTRFSQGTGSLKARVENAPGGYGYPGVELRIANGDPLADWSAYEVFLYDVWPEVNASARDQAPDLYWYKLYNACGGSPVTQGGPPLALDGWNQASISLNPLDSCWPAAGLDLSSITRMEFHTRDNDTVNGNSGLWDDGDVLTLWFDNLRLVDQDVGTVRWQVQPGATHYYVYFDVLAHEGHPLPTLDATLGAATVAGVVGSPEAGGYYHTVAGVAGAGDLAIWTAPTVEKILRSQAAPVHEAPLRIAAARGEFEPFQLVVRSPSARSLAVAAGPFTKGGDTLPAPTLHRVDYVEVTTAGDHFDRFGPWPDPLWPLDNGDTAAFPAGQNQPLWFTLQVPWDAAPGIYRGAVTIGTATAPVEVEVWDFALPRAMHLDSEWGFGWSAIVEDVYQGYGDWTCYWELVEAFKQDFIDHRMIPKGVAWPAGLNYPGGIEYDCETGVLAPDAWGDWDFATIGGTYIHGENGFNGGYGFPVFYGLGPTSNWPPDSLPYSFCGVSRSGVLGSQAYQDAWTQYLSALDAYLVSDGYAGGAYYHIVNEPQTFDDYTIVGQISALTASAAPHLRQLVSEQVEPAIYTYPGAKIDVWMPTITNYEPVKSHDRQANHGEQVWWYYLYGDDPPLPNPVLMSHPGIEARITPWLAWAERVDGLLHYNATDWDPNPWEAPNVTGKDNGDGFLFYPPRKDGGDLDFCGQNGHRLVPSLRWEQLRDGMEDYEYLWLFNGGDPVVGVSQAADAYVAQVVRSRTRFSRVPTDLRDARVALAEALVGKVWYSVYLPLLTRK